MSLIYKIEEDKNHLDMVGVRRVFNIYKQLLDHERNKHYDRSLGIIQYKHKWIFQPLDDVELSDFDLQALRQILLKIALGKTPEIISI